MRANNLLLKLKNFGCGKVTNDDVARFGIKICFLNEKAGKIWAFCQEGTVTECDSDKNKSICISGVTLMAR